jgi:hypothetical protein
MKKKNIRLMDLVLPAALGMLSLVIGFNLRINYPDMLGFHTGGRDPSNIPIWAGYVAGAVLSHSAALSLCPCGRIKRAK